MKESVLTMVLSGLCVILSIGIAVGMLLEDHQAPEISLSGENHLVYTTGDPEEVLFADVHALDNRDGDVSDTLQIASIYPIEEGKAVVTYVAKDTSNNMGKLKRQIIYKEVSPEDSITEDMMLEWWMEQGATIVADAAKQMPKLQLSQNSANLKIGESFDVMRYISSAVDKNGNNLRDNVEVIGDYDMSRAGVYGLQIYVVDGQGIRSNIEIFTLTVEEQE